MAFGQVNAPGGVSEAALETKVDKTDAVFENSISMNRKPDTTVGKVSIAIGGAYSGQEAEASDYGTLAFGAMAKATGIWAMALGASCEADYGAAVGNGSKTISGNVFGDGCRSSRGLAIGENCINNTFYGLAAGYCSAVLQNGYRTPVSSYDASTKTLTCEDPYATLPGSFKEVKIEAGDEIAVIFEKTSAGYFPSGAEIKFCNVVSIDYDAKTITVDRLSVPSMSKPSFVAPTLKQMSSVNGHGGVACGTNCISYGNGALAMGIRGVATNTGSIAIGYDVQSNKSGLLACGVRNLESSDDSDRLIVGGGSNRNFERSNCFRVTTAGVYAAGNYNASGADYAEMFEWSDGNPEGQDYVGRFVTLDGEKIRLAGPDDFILGVVSGNPSIVGDVHDDQWQGMFETDIFGRFAWEDVPCPEEIEVDGEKIVIENTYRQKKLNPNYDGTQKYVPRSQRPEWAAVGMMGKLVMVDDGTCQINGWCAPGADGVATVSEAQTKFRVMARLDETHIRVLALPQ